MELSFYPRWHFLVTQPELQQRKGGEYKWLFWVCWGHSHRDNIGWDWRLKLFDVSSQGRSRTVSLQKSCWTYRPQKLLFLHSFFSQAKQAADAGDTEETHGNTARTGNVLLWITCVVLGIALYCYTNGNLLCCIVNWTACKHKVTVCASHLYTPLAIAALILSYSDIMYSY